ncbi:MAG: GntR family transcriptional regulator [Verrucomicrobia bacterium]|nr:GntR family transcriptional regulator [Verrucomicrobiota bacterium]
MKRHGRPIAKHEEIWAVVRREIVSGKYPPGALLPTRVQFDERFGATAPTVQKAFDRLRDDGFTEVRHRVGTVVSARPPHLFQYGLTLPTPPPDSRHESRFIGAIRLAATLFTERTGKKILFYENMSGQPREDFKKLVEDVNAERLAGIIHSRNMWFVDDPRLLSPTIPTITCASPGYPEQGGVMVFEYDSLLERGAAYLAAQGCRRVAVLEDSEGLGRHELTPGRRAVLERHGLELLENGYAALPASVPETARFWVRLLVSLQSDRHPDGLLVMDDNLTESVVRGLEETGRVASGFHVVTHNNFPMPVPQSIPLHVLGFHASCMLEAAVSYIDRCKAGENPSRFVRFSASTEGETAERRAGVAEHRVRQAALVEAG